MKLHVGCGTNKLAGWVNIDAVAACQPDLVHDISKSLPYDDQSADELRAEGVLEHFDKYMRYCVVADWARVLKVGGLLHIGVPDFEKLVNKRFKFNFDDFADTFFGENMWGAEFYIGHFGNHKWGYSKGTLKAFLNKFGIEPVKVETKGLNIHYLGKKVKHIDSKMMDQWQIHSHNNKFGAPRSSMSFEEVKIKIDQFNKNLNA